jgi:hypothetical protein
MKGSSVEFSYWFIRSRAANFVFQLDRCILASRKCIQQKCELTHSVYLFNVSHVIFKVVPIGNVGAFCALLYSSNN